MNTITKIITLLLIGIILLSGCTKKECEKRVLVCIDDIPCEFLDYSEWEELYKTTTTTTIGENCKIGCKIECEKDDNCFMTDIGCYWIYNTTTTTFEVK